MIKLKKNYVHVVMYHYVRRIKGSAHPNIKGVELTLFKRQLDYFQKNFNMITAEDLINYNSNRKELPKNSCLLTFDDGYKDHINFVFPELLKRKIKGVFFPSAKAVLERELLDANAIHFILDKSANDQAVLNKLFKLCLKNSITQKTLNFWIKNCTDNNKFDHPIRILIKRMLQDIIPNELRKSIISKLFKEFVGQNRGDFANNLYLTIDDLKTLTNAGMHVGSHGYEHFRLNKLSYKDQKKDLNNSIKFLKHIGVSINNWIMCYPYGAYNKDTIRILKDTKCALAFIDSGGKTDINSTNRFRLPRHDIKEFPFNEQ